MTKKLVYTGGYIADVCVVEISLPMVNAPMGGSRSYINKSVENLKVNTQ